MQFSPEEIIEWVKGKIEAARQSQETELQLGGLNLTELPETIGTLSSLQSLGLYFNSLTELPETLGQLSQLRVLILASNNLTDLPGSLAQLERLETLNLDNNPLNPELANAYKHGIKAVKAYLRNKDV